MLSRSSFCDLCLHGPNLDLKVEQLLWKLIQLRHASQTNLAKSCHRQYNLDESSDMGVEPKIGVVLPPIKT